MLNTNYYDIEYTEPYYTNQWVYKGKIKHKYLDEPYFLIETSTQKELVDSLGKYIITYDEKFANTYNSDLKKIRNSIYNYKFKFINWEILKNNKQLYWKRKSEFITYSTFGKPIGYSYVNDNKKRTWKPRRLPFFKKDKIFLENEKRFIEYEKEEKSWELDYTNEVNKIKTSYYNYESDTIVRYCRMIFIELEFHSIIKEILTTNNLKLAFDKEKKNLNIILILPSKDDSKYLLQDKIYIKSQNEYKVIYVNNEETNKRLEVIWKQIILVYIDSLFKNDKINTIDSISFNGVILNKTKYEMIIEKEKLYKKDSMQFNFKSIDDFINIFRRDAVILRKLRLEEVNITQYTEDNNKNLISLTIEREYLNKKAIEYITSFKYLKELYLVENDLKYIPNKILECSKLESLYIINNNIKEIPIYIESMSSLKILVLDNNLIEYIDKKLLKSFLDMPTLKMISLKNNPIQNLINKDISSLEKDYLISELLSISNKVLSKKILLNKTIPLIITEGKTDWKHLEKAFKRFQSNEFNLYQDLDIEFKKFEDISMSDSELDAYAQSHAKKINERKNICIFDRDLSKRVEDYGKNDFVHVANKQYINTLKDKCKVEYGATSTRYLEIAKKLDASKYQEINAEIRDILKGKEYKEWETLLNNNVYAFCIPKLSDELDEICIEFYYKEKDLKKENSEGKRLFIADEFEFKKNINNSNRFISKCEKYKTDTQSGKNQTRKVTLQYPNKSERGYVYKIEDKECNKSHNMNLSKNDFAENIYYDEEGFDNFDIENFKLIFDVIERIIND